MAQLSTASVMPNVPGPPTSPAVASTPTTARPPHGAQQNVFARLQALFPASSSGQPVPPSESKPLPHPPTRYLKTRIVTWNMHESLPKGDLHELFGDIPAYAPPSRLSTDPLDIPGVNPSSDGHPYHLFVIAGQECPSVTGLLPMGLGAGFRLKEKEKERDRDRDKDRDRENKPVNFKDKDEHEISNVDLSSTTSLPIPAIHPAGWSAVLDDWFCKGLTPHTAGALRAHSKSVPATPSPRQGGDNGSEPSAVSRPSMSMEEAPQGPYELLVKERMMGLYLAVYIYRGLRPLVQGTSKSAVTAGLIGGRVGNKGGVAISLKIADTTLLFLNAHLAAHEGKVVSRLANMAKIKSELAVNDFLSSDDPRVMAEDITDRFDFAFVFGDLNFRLDISRLHADWLISRQDYAQALTFDQLRNIMAKQEAFVGFKEAPIDFPPTFKYDVKKRKLTLSRRHSHVPKSELEVESVGEVEEHEAESEDEEEDEPDGEATSVVSSRSAWTSAKSKLAEEDDEYDYFHISSQSKAKATAVANKMQHLWHGEARLAAHKAKERAKEKMKSMLSPAGTPGEVPLWKRHSSRLSVALNVAAPPTPLSFSNSSTPGALSSPDLPAHTDHSTELASTQPHHVIRAHSTRAILQMTAAEDENKGVYDSSHKKRVPSWCDRILWKSTLLPDVEEDDAESVPARPRTRVAQLLSLAFRRRRRDSYTSSISSESTHQPLDDPLSPTAPPTPPPESLEDGLSTSPSVESPVSPYGPFSRFAGRSRRPASSMPMGRSQTVGLQPGSGVQRQLSHDDLRARRRAFTSISPLLLQEHSQSAASLVSPSQPTAADTNGVPLSDFEAAVLSPMSPQFGQPHPATIASGPAFRRLLPFLPWERGSASMISLESPAPAPESTDRRPRKGDVICVSYNTLDDKAMGRLEGRSDHRPVLGSYVMYV